MPIDRPAASVILGATVVLAGCGGQSSPSASPSAPASITPSVHASASVIPALPTVATDQSSHPPAGAVAAAKPGEIIESVEIQSAPDTRAWFVVYGSTGLDGKPVAVSGLILAPVALPPAGHGNPIIAWAHGTTGIADQCSPSRMGVSEVPAELVALVSQGNVITATDYEGLGTDGIHPYLVGTSEGRSVLDAIRAAIALPDAHAAQGSAVIGLSQGGHAALWAANLKASYAPELTVLGALAASPPTDMVGWETWAFKQAAAGKVGVALAPVMMFGVWNSIYGAPLDFLTDAGRASALAAPDACDPPMPPTTPYQSDPAKIAEWHALLKGNSPGTLGTAVPIRVVSPKDDQLVSYDSQFAGVATMCAIGDNVDFVSVPGAHDASLEAPDAWRSAILWITDRLLGMPADSKCPS